MFTGAGIRNATRLYRRVEENSADGYDVSGDLTMEQVNRTYLGQGPAEFKGKGKKIYLRHAHSNHD